MSGAGGKDAIERCIDIMNRLAVDELADVFTVRDDKLAAFTEYFDPLVFQQAQVP